MTRPEQKIQKAVIKQLRARAYPGVVYWHTNNNVAMRGGARLGAILKSLGVLAGVSDILLFYGTLFCLELKPKGGRPTESQLQFIDAIQKAGGHGVIAEGFDEAIRCLESWELIRGQTQ